MQKTEPKTETAVNLVKPKPNRKLQVFAKPNRKPNRSHFLLTAHPYCRQQSLFERSIIIIISCCSRLTCVCDEVTSRGTGCEILSDDELLMLTNEGELAAESLAPSLFPSSVKSNHDDGRGFSASSSPARFVALSVSFSGAGCVTPSVGESRLIRLLRWRSSSSFCCLYPLHSFCDSAYSWSNIATACSQLSQQRSHKQFSS